MSKSTQNLHGVIGDYMREIDKIKRQAQVKAMTKKEKITKMTRWRKKIREATLELQKNAW